MARAPASTLQNAKLIGWSFTAGIYLFLSHSMPSLGSRAPQSRKLIFSMCVCGFIGVHVCVCAYTHTWRLNVDIRCLSPAFSTFIEAGTPAEPGACWASVVSVPGKYTVSAS